MKINLEADLVVYDELSMIYYNGGETSRPIEYTTQSLVQKALGGTEFQILLLMDEYNKLGKKVVCFNNNLQASTCNGIEFIPRKQLSNYSVRCKNLVTSRYSRIPLDIQFEKCFIWMHDVAMPGVISYAPLFESSNKFTIVCPSQWSRSLFPAEWPVRVINNMIPDWVYSFKPTQPKKDFIYASAALKGLQETLIFWDHINKNHLISNTKLKILSPGYDTPDRSNFTQNSLSFLGALPFHRVVEEIANSKALFYVNNLPETFCIVAVLCEILGTPMHILTLRGDGALPETINTSCIYHDYMRFIKDVNNMTTLRASKDYRISTIFKQWLQLLN